MDNKPEPVEKCDKCLNWAPAKDGEYFSIPRRGDYFYCADCSKSK